MQIPRPGVANICFLIAIFALLIVQMPGFADDPGLGWHLANGQWILSHHAIPRYDPFLYAQPPRQWVSDQWLSDVLFFSLYSWKGWPLLYAFIATAYVTTFLLLLYGALRRRSGLHIGAALGALFAFKIAQVHFIVRPVVLSFFFFTLVYLLLLEAPRRFTRRYLAIPAIMLLWANLHPSFVLGLQLIFVWGVAIFLSSKDSSERRDSFVSALGVFVLAACASLVNPYGYSLHESIFALGRNTFFMGLHEEWRSPNLSEYDGQLFLLASIVVWPCLLLSRRFRKRLGLFGLFSWILFFVLSIDAVRMLPYFGILTALPLAYAIGLFATGHWARRLGVKSAGHKLQKRLLRLGLLERKAFSSSYGVVAVLLLILLASLSGRVPLYEGAFGPSLDKFPYETVRFLKGQAGSGRIAVASHPDWGGFITFWGEGSLQPVIDDRNTLIGETFYRSYFARMTASVESASAFMRELGVKYFLLPKDSKLAERTQGREEFRLLFRDDKSVVIEQRR